MIDHGVALPHYRLHVVPAVVSLASPTWQREVWLDPDQFEDLDYTVHVLFDDFCDANNPSPWLGQCLRSEEEVELMARLGTAYGARYRTRWAPLPATRSIWTHQAGLPWSPRQPGWLRCSCPMITWR